MKVIYSQQCKPFQSLRSIHYIGQYFWFFRYFMTPKKKKYILLLYRMKISKEVVVTKLIKITLQHLLSFSVRLDTDGMIQMRNSLLLYGDRNFYGFLSVNNQSSPHLNMTWSNIFSRTQPLKTHAMQNKLTRI